MRFVAGWLGALGLVVGCTVPPDAVRTCSTDEDCGSEGACDLARGLCYAIVPEELPEDSCSPACPSYEACTASGCVARFAGMRILAPDAGSLIDGGTVQVVAQLEVTPTFAARTSFPATIDFSAAHGAGGANGSFGAVSHDDAGTYTAAWMPPPSQEVSFTLRAAHPEPGAELNASVNVTVDGVPPVFFVHVPPFDAGVSDGGTVYADPDGGVLTNLWPRNQQVPVEVRTNEPNLAPGSVRMALRGTDNVVGTPVAVSPLTTGCDAGFCGVAQLNLWEPAFNAFRAGMPLEVQGNDRAGNAGTASPPAPQVNVTRWKWAFRGTSGNIVASPAIGNQGTVYLGVSPSGAEGKVIALHPDGTKRWETSVGEVVSVAVGAADGGVENIYTAARTTGQKSLLYALSSDDGGVVVRCPDATGYSGDVSSTMAVMDTTLLSTTSESGVAVVNDGANTALYAVRPAASGGAQCALSNSGAAILQSNPGSTLIAGGTTFIYPPETPSSVVSYEFRADSPKWTATTGHPINGLAFAGGIIVGGGGSTATSGALYSAPASGVTAPATQLAGTTGGRVWNPVVGTSGATVFFGQDTASNQGDLKRYNLSGASVTHSKLNVGVLRYAPALGAGGVLYTAPSNSSVVSAWTVDDLNLRWSVTLSGATNSAAVALDCARTGGGQSTLGTLYVPAGGTLYAIIVDSPGLDPGAAWPKHQRDARNTGNPATPVTNCPP
jgi:hypothetical protein